MRRRSSVSILSALAVAAGLAVAVVPAGSAAPQAAPASRSAGPTVYVGDLTAKQFGALHGAGLDREDISAEPQLETRSRSRSSPAARWRAS